MNLCKICEVENSSPLRTLTERGQKSLILASKRRCDGKDSTFKAEVVQVHEKCRKKYTHKDQLYAIEKKVTFHYTCTVFQSWEYV